MSNSNDLRLANLLTAAATGVGDALRQAMLRASGLDLAASTAVVALLDFAPGGSISDLSAVLGLTHSGTVRLVDRLVAAGWVRRGAGADARARRITLTRSGRAVARRIRQAGAASALDLCGSLTAEERTMLTDLTERLIGRITESRLVQRAAGVPPEGGALCRLCDFTACGRPDGRCPAQLTVARARTAG